MRGSKFRMLDRRDEGPISIGANGKFGAIGGVVGVGWAEQRVDSTGAGALGGARGAHVAPGARVLFGVFVLRRRARNERRRGWAPSCGGARVSAIFGHV